MYVFPVLRISCATDRQSDYEREKNKEKEVPSFRFFLTVLITPCSWFFSTLCNRDTVVRQAKLFSLLAPLSGHSLSTVPRLVNERRVAKLLRARYANPLEVFHVHRICFRRRFRTRICWPYHEPNGAARKGRNFYVPGQTFGGLQGKFPLWKFIRRWRSNFSRRKDTGRVYCFFFLVSPINRL